MPFPTVLYDSQMFDLQNYGGITRYFANLIVKMKEESDFAPRLPLLYSTNYYVRDFDQLLHNPFGKIWLRKGRRRKKWNRLYCTKILNKENFDIFHPTYYDPYFLDHLKKPLAITVHDMIHENYSHLFDDSEKVIKQKKEVIEAADLIIAISKFTRQEIIRYYPHKADNIKVIYHGIPDEPVIADSAPLPERFLLYVGDRLSTYKNFVPFATSIAELIRKEKDLYLICAGGGSFSKAEQSLFKGLGIASQTMQMNVSDGLLAQLYQQAAAFIYPSLEEGFGLPMLEAFKYGCPIACSQTSCLPEVGGTAVSYFDPLNPEAIFCQTASLINNPDLRHQQIAEGRVQLNKFTFEQCYTETAAAYRTLLH